MKFDFGAIFDQILGFYIRLPFAQKIALPVLAVSCMALIMFVSNWATQPEYAVLYSNLSDADASGVVERLKDEKIGYRLTNGGKTIEVTPRRIVHDIRLDMASSGLPKGDQVGYELWNEAKLGLSSFGESINYVRAVQGELERTVLKIEGVGAARVHITTPKRSVFASRDVPPTASVLLKLKAGSELSVQQTKGIAHLVAGSIERLKAENVTILDQFGKMLTQDNEDTDMSGADLNNLQYQRKIEEAYSKRIESMLSEILGHGRSVARVTATVDFSRMEKEEEAYDPGGMVMRSERLIEESDDASMEGGVPGVLSNLPNQSGVTAEEGMAGNSTRRENVRNYEVSRAVSKVVKTPGKIERLSVAVLVDGKYNEIDTGAMTDDGEAVKERQYMPLNPEMVKKVENLVKQTVGYDAARGDIITVENIRFVEPDESLLSVLEKTEMTQNMWKIVDYVPAVLLFLVTLLVVIKPMVKFLVTPTDAEVDLSRLLPAGIEELEAELESERSKLSSIPEKAKPTIDIEELETLLADNSRMVKDNPQQAALLIRYWLNEGRV